MRYLLIISLAVFIVSCSTPSMQSGNWQQRSITNNNPCYPNPSNKSTYGVPQKWFC